MNNVTGCWTSAPCVTERTPRWFHDLDTRNLTGKAIICIRRGIYLVFAVGDCTNEQKQEIADSVAASLCAGTNCPMVAVRHNTLSNTFDIVDREKKETK